MTLRLPDADGAVLPDESLAPHTTLKIGGPARWFCRVRTEAGLARVLETAAGENAPVALLGMGSNVLVADEGFPGYVVRLEGDFLRVTIEEDFLTAGGGAALGGICAAAARALASALASLFFFVIGPPPLSGIQVYAYRRRPV